MLCRINFTAELSRRPQPPLPLPQPPHPKRAPPRVTWSNPPPAPPPSRLPPKFPTRRPRPPPPTRPAPVRTRRPIGGVPVDTPGGINEPLDLKPIDPFERAKRGETTVTVESTTKSLFQELVDGTKPIPKVISFIRQIIQYSAKKKVND